MPSALRQPKASRQAAHASRARFIAGISRRPRGASKASSERSEAWHRSAQRSALRPSGRWVGRGERKVAPSTERATARAVPVRAWPADVATPIDASKHSFGGGPGCRARTRARTTFFSPWRSATRAGARLALGAPAGRSDGLARAPQAPRFGRAVPTKARVPASPCRDDPRSGIAPRAGLASRHRDARARPRSGITMPGRRRGPASRGRGKATARHRDAGTRARICRWPQEGRCQRPATSLYYVAMPPQKGGARP